MAKKYIRLNENGNLSQVVEFKDGDRRVNGISNVKF